MKKKLFSPLELCIMCLVCAVVTLSGCSKDPLLNRDASPTPEEAMLKSSGDYTEAEIESLMFMVEEEKLAHDVYVKMFELHELKIFDLISQSETRHVQAVSKLIAKTGLDNPIIGNAEGEFENEELQRSLNHRECIAHGLSSRVPNVGLNILV